MIHMLMLRVPFKFSPEVLLKLNSYHPCRSKITVLRTTATMEKNMLKILAFRCLLNELFLETESSEVMLIGDFSLESSNFMALRNGKVQDKKHLMFLSKYFAENGKEKLFPNDSSFLDVPPCTL